MKKEITTDFFDAIIKIKSYSIEEKIRCAEKIGRELKNMGLNVKLISTQGAPIVWAKLDVGAKENILFYSHYDVKPEGNIKAWKTEPFYPYYDLEKNRVYARGAGDDKGQLYATILGLKEAINSEKNCYIM